MRLLEHRPHERTLITNKTLRLFVVTHSGLAFWIIGRFSTICFIGRKRRKRKQGKSDIISTFVRHEVAVMLATEFLNQWYPHLSVSLKLLALERIDHIAKIASNQSILPKGLTVTRAVAALCAAASSSLNDYIHLIIQHSDAAQLPAR